MEIRRIAVIEIFAGLAFIFTGLILWWWSKQLLWILIYPPLAKRLIDSLPFIFWILGTLLFVDGVRRVVRNQSV